MLLKVLFSVGALIFGCLFGFLNAFITKRLVNEGTSINKIMLSNMSHVAVAAVCLALVLLAAKLLGMDSTIPLLTAATGVVFVPIVAALLNKSK